MDGILIVAVLTAALLTLGVAEQIRHRRRLRAIPIRIHVNGTRGKSSVTRLIAAGLRAAGIPTLAKTTGTLARVILPNGDEFPVFRLSRPNIIEQLRIVAMATEAKAQALVVECMALQPILQALSEHKMIRATHGVVTNVRADHLDVMGPTEHDVALAFAGALPENGTVFTMPSRHQEMLAAGARRRGSQLVTVSSQTDPVAEDEMEKFTYIEHPNNVALALGVCRALGVERQTALQGMWRAPPDPGVLQTFEIDLPGGRRLIFANGFAANDPEPTETIWNLTLQRYPDVERRIALFNCRIDRSDRSRQLGSACATWTPADAYVLMGSGTYLFARAARKSGLDMRKITFAERQSVGEIFETVVDVAGRSALVMGMGNIAHQGLELVRFFRNRSRLPEAA